MYIVAYVQQPPAKTNFHVFRLKDLVHNVYIEFGISLFYAVAKRLRVFTRYMYFGLVCSQFIIKNIDSLCSTKGR